MGRAVITVRGAPIGLLSIFVSVLASMGGFVFGYDTGQISSILLMPDFLSRFGHTYPDGTASFNVYQEGWIVSSLSVGTLIGVILGSYLADFLGRRKAMTTESIVFIIGVIIQVTAEYSWGQIVCGRIITGLGVGALSLAVPVYQSECAPKQIRGSLIAIYQLQITLGILVAALIDFGTKGLGNSGEWRIPIGLSIIWPLILGIGILFMPESPRWLLTRGRKEECIHAIARLRGCAHDHDNPFVQQDYMEIAAVVEAQEAIGHATWADCFKTRNRTLYRTIMGMFLQALQQLTGANYFFYYGATIFQGVGLTSPYVSQIILNAVNVGCTFLGLYFMEAFGRRRPLIFGALGMSVFLFIFAAVGVAKDPLTDPPAAKTLIATACLFILCYASTWAPGVWILIGESFPLATRAKQGSLSTASNWFWNFMIAFFTQPIVGDIGFNYGFVFAGCNLFGCFFVYFVLYESAGLPLEAVDIMYNDPNCKPWQSVTWVPPGYSSRYALAREVDKQATMEAQIERSSQDTAVGDGMTSPDKAEKGQVEKIQAQAIKT